MTAFALVFIGVLLSGALLNFCIGLLVKATGLSGTDRLLGMLFGFVRGALIVMIFLIYVPQYLPVKEDPWFQQSQLIPYFQPFKSTVENTMSTVSHWVMNLLSSSGKPKD